MPRPWTFARTKGAVTAPAFGGGAIEDARSGNADIGGPVVTVSPTTGQA